jgi:hypothetical protein
MTCHICEKPITERQRVENHHPIYKSRGGTQTAPTHKSCHRNHHQQQGDYRIWGRKSSLSMRWAFNLSNVRTHPTYEDHRLFYLMNYAQAGCSAGLIM